MQIYDAQRLGEACVYAAQVFVSATIELGGISSVQANFSSTGPARKAAIHAAPRDCTFHLEPGPEAVLVAWD